MNCMHEAFAHERIREDHRQAEYRRLADAMASGRRWQGLAARAAQLASYLARRAARSEQRVTEHSVVAIRIAP
jgi:hypothetical protein